MPVADIPYKELHIYYLEERIKPDCDCFGKEFIGMWHTFFVKNILRKG